MFSIDPATGLILIYGIYPILSVKGVIFALTSGLVGAVMVFFDKVGGIKNFFLRFIVGVTMGYIVFGILEDHIKIEPKQYVAGIVGFLSYPAFRWIFENLDGIVESVLNKIFKKVGIDFNEKDKEKDKKE